jgi:hypothetical protein
MADDKEIKEPGSITQKADSNMERISEVSNVSRTIANMQKKVDQQLREAESKAGETESIQEVQNSMIKVMDSLAKTVSSIGRGFGNVAAGTAKASTDALKQYGDAISKDISFNKQNIVAMALSRSTPVFGYFAAKFMETDVFKNAAARMKANIAETLGGVTTKFKEGVGSLFSKVRKSGRKERPIKTVNEGREGVPKMQKGGYVEKGGLVQLHAAEVVMPIEKILHRIDESISTTKELASISKQAQLKTLAKMGTYVEGVDKIEKVGIFKGFIKAMNDVQTRHLQPANKRMLRAVLSIQDAMGAQVGTMQQVWQKMLVEHPTFRNIMFSLRGLKAVLGTPIDLVYQIVKSRGGYAAQLSRSKNPMQAAAENIGLVYAEGMWRLDNIAKFTKATAEATRDLSSAFTGRKYERLEGVSTGRWSLLGFGRTLLNLGTKWGIKGIGTLADAFTPKKWDLRIRQQADALAEALTKERRNPLDMFGRRAELDKIYGSGGEGSQPFSKSFKGEPIPVIDVSHQKMITDNGAIVVTDKSSQKLIEFQEKTDKKNKKLLGLAKENTEANKDVAKIEKRRSIFSAFSSIFRIGKSLFSSVMGFLPMLLGGKGLFSTLLFGPGGTAGLVSKITNFIKGPAIWAAAGKGLAVAGAFKVGWAIGKKIDDLLGISRKVMERMGEADKKGYDLARSDAQKQVEALKLAKSDAGSEGLKAATSLKIQAGLGSETTSRRKDVGIWGRGNMLKIDSAQRLFMNENIDKYMKYGPEQVMLMRNKWLKEGGYVGKGYGYDAGAYGKAREAAFLNYLEKNGRILSEMEYDKLASEHRTKTRDRSPFRYYADEFSSATTEKIKSVYENQKDKLIKLRDKTEEVRSDLEKLARGATESTIATTKAIGEAGRKQYEALKEGSKETVGAFQKGIMQNSQVVSNSVQNVSRTIVNQAQQGSGYISERAKQILAGSTIED